MPGLRAPWTCVHGARVAIRWDTSLRGQGAGRGSPSFRALEIHRRRNAVRVAAHGRVLPSERDAVHVEGPGGFAGGCRRHIRRRGGPRSRGAGPVDVVPKVVGGRTQAHGPRGGRGKSGGGRGIGARIQADGRPGAFGAGNGDGARRGRVRTGVGDHRIVGEGDPGRGNGAVRRDVAGHREGRGGGGRPRVAGQQDEQSSGNQGKTLLDKSLHGVLLYERVDE